MQVLRRSLALLVLRYKTLRHGGSRSVPDIKYDVSLMPHHCWCAQLCQCCHLHNQFTGYTVTGVCLLPSFGTLKELSW